MPPALFATKLYIPPVRLTLLSGPAGFGKTTLLSEFIARLQAPGCWSPA